MIFWLLTFLPLLHSPTIDTPPDPPSQDSQKVPLPYSSEERHEWEWTQEGIPVGKTTVLLIAPEPEQDHWGLDARLRWSRQGRSLDLRQRTDFSPDSLEPIRTRKEGRISALGVGDRRLVVATEISNHEARIVVQSPDEGTQIDRRLPFPAGSVVLENQSFEHWILIAAQLARKKKAASPGSHIFSALIPSEYRTLKLELTFDRQEKSGSQTLLRWNVKSTDFSAKIWISPEGTLERYQQDSVQIRRIVSKK
ncbi:MAG: hypothetical protein AAEJ04_06005 [Planctomycetota bacterium]